MRRYFFPALSFLLCLMQGCAHEQQRSRYLCNHPNLLVNVPSKIGIIGGGCTIGVVMAVTAGLSCVVALPFGCEKQVETFFSSNKVAAIGPDTGTYLIGGPFYLLFGWWGPGHISTGELKMQATQGNQRLQFLHYYRIHGTDLKGADLSDLDLRGCDLHGIDFSDANLKHAKLSYCDLSGTIFHNANLTGAELQRAYLAGADLRGADLSGADLSGPPESYLPSTILDNVKLEGANLSKTNLQRVKGLSQDELHRAKNWQDALQH